MSETIKIKSDAEGHDGHMVINKADFDEKTMKEYKDPREEEPAPAADPRGAKNPSGTYSEPTPTNINFPDKDATEFENNHGAFVGKSAAQLREEKGLPDAPGGIKPAEAARVQKGVDAVAALASAEPLSDEAEQAAEAEGDTPAKAKK